MCLAQNLTFWKIRKKNLATFLAHLRKVWWISEKKSGNTDYSNIHGYEKIRFNKN
jgi:hypothetical protein